LKRILTPCRREELGSEDFDFLVLALGTFTEEFIPPLFKSPEAGIEILHSKKYRNADRFASKVRENSVSPRAEHKDGLEDCRFRMRPAVRDIFNQRRFLLIVSCICARGYYSNVDNRES